MGETPASLAGPHFFVADLADPRLDGSDEHHARRVLRVRDGESLTLGDGKGSWRAARWVGHRAEVVGPVVHVAEPHPVLTVAFALVKGERPELVVQKLTEIGVDVVVPFVAARSVVRWDGERADRAVGRLRAVARAAAMQSKRVRLPHVGEVSRFAEVVESAAGGAKLAVLGGGPLGRGDTTVLVGPEGGWADEELAAVPGRVGLGRSVLRAETAAIVAGAQMVAVRDGFASPA